MAGAFQGAGAFQVIPAFQAVVAAGAAVASGGWTYWPDHRRKREDDEEEPAPAVVAQAVEVAARKVVARILAPRPVVSVEALERRELDAALDRVDVARTELLEARMRLEVSRVLAHHKRLMAEDDELLLF